MSLVMFSLRLVRTLLVTHVESSHDILMNRLLIFSFKKVPPVYEHDNGKISIITFISPPQEPEITGTWGT